MRLKAILPVLVIAVAIGGAFALMATRETVQPKPQERRLPSVRVIVPETTSVQLNVRSQGTVMPRTESQLIPEVSGPVVWTSPSLASGGYFEAGELLARIDPSRYKTAARRAQAALSRAEGEFEYAQAMLRRQQQLASEEIVSANLFEDAQRQLSVADASLRDAQAALEEAHRDLQRTEIKAPFRGRVREETVDVGQFVNVGTPFATLYATDYLEVRLPVPDDELAYLDVPLWEEGHSDLPAVRLYTRFAGEDRSWRGRVVRTEGEIDTRSRMVHVIARVENPRESSGGEIPIPVGLFVQAEIDARRASDVFVLPRAALYDEQNVVVVDAEDRLRVRPVSVLRVERDEVIVSSGLAVGERICAAPPGDLIEGQQVQTYGEDDVSPSPAPVAEATGE